MSVELYGVTWATAGQSVAQTGYDYPTVALAQAAALAGPTATAMTGVQVDALDSVWAPGVDPEDLYGAVETADDLLVEVRVGDRMSPRRLATAP